MKYDKPYYIVTFLSQLSESSDGYERYEIYFSKAE
jgi:hypothetical protein